MVYFQKTVHVTACLFKFVLGIFSDKRRWYHSCLFKPVSSIFTQGVVSTSCLPETVQCTKCYLLLTRTRMVALEASSVDSTGSKLNSLIATQV